jgi:hypothetical protein
MSYISPAQRKRSHALFAQREFELVRELEKESFDVNIEFISDWKKAFTNSYQ